MQLMIINEAEVDADLDARIRDGLCECFPAGIANFSRTRRWHGTGPSYTVLLDDETLVAAHVGVVDRTMTVGSWTGRIAGVQNVFVRPAYRGRGLSERVLQAAMDEAGRRAFDFGLLFCYEKLLPIYARCGWITLPVRDAVRFDEAQREVPLPPANRAMYYPLRQAEFPPGLIHLRGNDW